MTHVGLLFGSIVTVAEQMKQSVYKYPIEFIRGAKAKLDTIIYYPIITDENIADNWFRRLIPMIKR